MTGIELRHRIEAPPELLWSYLSTAVGLACWQADQVQGSLDEGSFSLRWPQLGARMDLSVAEVETQRRILLRAGDHVVQMSLDGSTLQLLHDGLHPEDDLDGLRSSWDAALSLLQIAVTSHPRKSRSVSWIFRPIEAQAELTHYYFTEPQGLSSWLGETDSVLKRGEPFTLRCDERTLSGDVLCCERDVCLRVHELQSGALTFRTLPAPGQTRVVAIGLSSWTGKPEQELLELLENALARLARVTERAGC